MRILLINPSLHQANIGHYKEKAEKQRGVYPPLGLAYIASTLEQNNHQVQIVDCDISTKDLKEAFRSLRPQAVGFYVMTWTYPQAAYLAKKIKEFNKDITTIIGGPNVTSLPQESLQFGDFDFGVIGEGERTIIELIERIESNENDFSDILGLAYKKNKEIIINPPRPLMDDLDTIPFPARHLLKPRKYFDIFARRKHFSTIIATRGCPFQCTFCDRKNRMGRNWRKRSPENIAQEIEEIQTFYSINEFMFFDDNLIVDKNWGLELCKQLKPLKITWECRNRVDLLDKEMLTAMKEAGCYRIRLGFESGDNNILKTLKKDITVEQSLECAQLCKEIGIEIFGYFMLGVPEETEETMQKTIDLAIKLDPSFALFSKAILIPGSEFFDYGVDNQQIDRDHWKNFLIGKEQNGAPSLNRKELPEEIVNKYISLANKKFYMRPSFAIKKILAIRSLRQLISQIKIGFSLLF